MDETQTFGTQGGRLSLRSRPVSFSAIAPDPFNSEVHGTIRIIVPIPRRRVMVIKPQSFDAPVIQGPLTKLSDTTVDNSNKNLNAGSTVDDDVVSSEVLSQRLLHLDRSMSELNISLSSLVNAFSDFLRQIRSPDSMSILKDCLYDDLAWQVKSSIIADILNKVTFQSGLHATIINLGLRNNVELGFVQYMLLIRSCRHHICQDQYHTLADFLSCYDIIFSKHSVSISELSITTQTITNFANNTYLACGLIEPVRNKTFILDICTMLSSVTHDDFLNKFSKVLIVKDLIFSTELQKYQQAISSNVSDDYSSGSSDESAVKSRRKLKTSRSKRTQVNTMSFRSTESSKRDSMKSNSTATTTATWTASSSAKSGRLSTVGARSPPVPERRLQRQDAAIFSRKRSGIQLKDRYLSMISHNKSSIAEEMASISIDSQDVRSDFTSYDCFDEDDDMDDDDINDRLEAVQARRRKSKRPKHIEDPGDRHQGVQFEPALESTLDLLVSPSSSARASPTGSSKPSTPNGALIDTPPGSARLTPFLNRFENLSVLETSDPVCQDFEESEGDALIERRPLSGDSSRFEYDRSGSRSPLSAVNLKLDLGSTTVELESKRSSSGLDLESSAGSSSATVPPSVADNVSFAVRLEGDGKTRTQRGTFEAIVEEVRDSVPAAEGPQRPAKSGRRFGFSFKGLSFR